MWYVICQYFLLICDSPSFSLGYFSWEWKCLGLEKFNCYFSFMDHALVFTSKNFLQKDYILFQGSYTIHFTHWPRFIFSLLLCERWGIGQGLLSCVGHLLALVSFIEKAVLSLLNSFCNMAKSHLTPLVSLCISVYLPSSRPHCLNCSFIVPNLNEFSVLLVLGSKGLWLSFTFNIYLYLIFPCKG